MGINQAGFLFPQPEGHGVDREIAAPQVLGQGLALKEGQIHVDGLFPLVTDHPGDATPAIQRYEVGSQVVGQSTGQ